MCPCRCSSRTGPCSTSRVPGRTSPSPPAWAGAGRASPGRTMAGRASPGRTEAGRPWPEGTAADTPCLDGWEPGGVNPNTASSVCCSDGPPGVPQGHIRVSVRFAAIAQPRSIFTVTPAAQNPGERLHFVTVNTKTRFSI